MYEIVTGDSNNSRMILSIRTPNVASKVKVKWFQDAFLPQSHMLRHTSTNLFPLLSGVHLHNTPHIEFAKHVTYHTKQGYVKTQPPKLRILNYTNLNPTIHFVARQQVTQLYSLKWEFPVNWEHIKQTINPRLKWKPLESCRVQVKNQYLLFNR